MNDFKVLDRIRTPDEPDVIVVSPANSSLLVVGTYHLAEDGRRTGALLLYSADTHTSRCRLVQAASCGSAVLDAKWLPHRPGLLAVALANGSIELYDVNIDTDSSASLRKSNAVQASKESSLVLSLAVSTSTHLLATFSTGEISAGPLHSDKIERWTTWKAHDLEVWCGAWKSTDVVLSGGDDTFLKIWDLREDCSKPQAFNKSHGAGVVSILPVTDTLFLTGSYDNQMRSFDYRSLRHPLSSVDLNGGVWRILPRPGSNSTSFLACCMQQGARMVTLMDNGTFDCQAKFEPLEEQRLVYGGSWQSENIAALCSFYEKQVYICNIP